MDYLYNDKALFVNEITERNFDQVWNRMLTGGLFNPDIVRDKSKKKQLESIIKIKNISRRANMVYISRRISYIC